MENKLKMLFDYQLFERNAELEAIIRDSEERFEAALSDEDLAFVNAAGDPYAVKRLEIKDE